MVDRAYLLLRVSPWQCLTSPVMIGSPSPSHRTFSFPEYGGPTVFIAHHAQVAPCTRACRCQCRRVPSHTACCSENVSIRTPGLYFSGSSTGENGYSRNAEAHEKLGWRSCVGNSSPTPSRSDSPSPRMPPG